MDNHDLRSQLHRAADTRLSGLRSDPWLVQRVLNQAKERPKLKKKFSVGTVLILVFLMLLATALAVATLHEAAPWIAQTEQEEGDFITWPVGEKAALLSILVEQDEILLTPEIESLLGGAYDDDEAGRMIDALIADFIGFPPEEISFMLIMEAAWGQFDTWSDEDRAWYSQVMDGAGINQSDKTVYVYPDGKISRDEAIAIAKREIMNGYQVDSQVLDSYLEKHPLIVNYQLPEFRENEEEQPYWYICLDVPRDPDEQIFYFTELFIHPETGELLQSVEELIKIRETTIEEFSHPAP